jgi:hypothetical protein
MDYKHYEPKIRKDQGKLYSLSALLKKNEIPRRAADINIKLRDEGYIIKGTRESTTVEGKIREYNKLSKRAEGIYGENYTSEHSFEPSIKWYEKTFLTLLGEIGFKQR